jgi:Cu2+-exporting ATPase
MIREAGFEDYYARQDRAGRPVGDDPFDRLDSVSMRQIQEQAEISSGSKILLRVGGMSCLGCAWLVEQVARRQSGVIDARVALDSNRLSLVWRRGDFDLSALAGELLAFGYRIEGDAASSGFNPSPLAFRFCLTLVFSLNGLFLLAASESGLGGPGLRQLYDVFILVCLFFAQLIGGALFTRPAWRGLLIGRLQSDVLPALACFLGLGWALAALLFSDQALLPVLSYFLLLPVLLFARWLSETWALRTCD